MTPDDELKHLQDELAEIGARMQLRMAEAVVDSARIDVIQARLLVLYWLEHAESKPYTVN